MRTNLQRENHYGKAFLDVALQVNWTTASIQIDNPVAALNSYPVLLQSTDPLSRYKFTNESMIFGIDFSVTWFSASAAEKACIAVASGPGPAQLSILGGSAVWKQTEFVNRVTTAAASAVLRTPGFVFPIPFTKWVQKDTFAQFYGTGNVNMGYSALATIYFCPIPEFQRFMQNAIG